jgi:FkbM family methyltransferase
MATVDPQLLKFAADFVGFGDCVWDIGANLGLFSVAAAGLSGPSGQVLAVEPDLWLGSTLCRTAMRNPNAAPITVLSAAISGRSGLAVLNVANQSRAMNSLEGFGHEGAGGVRSRQAVLCVTMDELLEFYAAPAVVKIDVEKAEVDVLEGGERLLSEVRPVIHIEVADDNADAIGKILRHHRYDLYDSENGMGVEKPVFTTVARPA